MEDDSTQTRPFRVLHEPTDHDRIVRIEAQGKTLESEIMMLRGASVEHSLALGRIEHAISESRRGPTWWYAATCTLLGLAVAALVALIGRLMTWW